MTQREQMWSRENVAVTSSTLPMQLHPLNNHPVIKLDSLVGMLGFKYYTLHYYAYFHLYMFFPSWPPVEKLCIIHSAGKKILISLKLAPFRSPSVHPLSETVFHGHAEPGADDYRKTSTTGHWKPSGQSSVKPQLTLIVMTLTNLHLVI